MKCPNCGAETKGAVCEYCGSEIRTQKKAGACCSKCGSTNIAFRRENQGEIRGKKSKQVVHRTVGYCKDCGNTWFASEDIPKKRKTWLWVLGWLFIFPLPLTILLLRKKDMKPVIKYVIIAVAWIIYLLIALSGNSSKESNTARDAATPQTQVEDTTTSDTQTATDGASQVDTTETQVYYEDDRNINLYVTRFNECNPDGPITVDELQKYYHHGREHDDQVKFYRDDFEIVITGGYKTEVYIGYTPSTSHTNEEYGAMFVKYAKAYNPELTEEVLQGYWQQVVSNSTSVIDFDGFVCTKSPSTDGRITYFELSGKLE